MGIFREIPPTAGFPLGLSDFLPSLEHGADLEKDFCAYLGVGYARVTYSGTAAFYFILETLKGISAKQTVVIPSYVCPLVPLAIKRAGLKIEVCDISLGRLDYDYRQLDNICASNNDILAVISVHLAGLPADFTGLRKAVNNRDIFIIEDCAQSLGAEYRGVKAGALGDFSFFSLCRGKGVTIYEGGVAAAKNKEYALLLDKKIASLEKGGGFSEALKIAELFGYWAFYRPQLAWFIFRLPQLFWELRGNKLKAATEYFAEDFPTHKVSAFRKSLGRRVFRRLDQGIVKQRGKAMFYLEALKRAKGVAGIEELPETKGAYPYLTLVFEQPQQRDKALKALQHCGLGVSQIYACAVTDYAYLKLAIPGKDCPNGRSLASRGITLSTNVFLEDKEMRRIINLLLSFD